MFRAQSIAILIGALVFLWTNHGLASSGANQDVVLIVHPAGSTYEETAKSFMKEAQSVFKVVSFDPDRRRVDRAFKRCMKREKPQLVILLDQAAINVYRRFVRNHAEVEALQPSLVLMTSPLKDALAGLPRAAGIDYQVQGVTSLVHLRALVDNPIRRVGVVYRERFAMHFDRQSRLCAEEDIELVGILLDDGAFTGRRLRRALRHLIENEKVDALWVLNDQVILRGALIKRAWQPALDAFDKPVVVGVESLVDETLRLGHLAVVPDHTSLGHQAFELTLEAQQNDWRFEQTIYLPIGVMKVLNLKLLDDEVDIRRDILPELDRVIR